ncbi:MAG: CDP-alcohol phosphatidyltransferase family protein [archaeon]|nr:CDP-alcohol phosphatidyltransferase family protein [archaeon]
MLFQVKKFSEKLLLPLGKRISKTPANYISIFGLIASIFAFIGFSFNVILLAIVSLFFIEFFDQLDGIVARLQGTTKFGGFLDSTLDRYGDFLIVFGIIIGGYCSYLLGLIVLVGAFLVSYTRARMEGLELKKIGGIGLFERTDRIPTLFIGSILFIIFPMWDPSALFWTMWILAVGTHITAIQRIYFAYKNL